MVNPHRPSAARWLSRFEPGREARIGEALDLRAAGSEPLSDGAVRRETGLRESSLPPQVTAAPNGTRRIARDAVPGRGSSAEIADRLLVGSGRSDRGRAVRPGAGSRTGVCAARRPSARFRPGADPSPARSSEIHFPSTADPRPRALDAEGRMPSTPGHRGYGVFLRRGVLSLASSRGAPVAAARDADGGPEAEREWPAPPEPPPRRPERRDPVDPSPRIARLGARAEDDEKARVARNRRGPKEEGGASTCLGR